MAQASTPTDRKPSIRRTGKYTFETKSRTREGVTHTQDVLHLKCSCEAGEKGMRCWHLVLALQAEQWYKRAEEQYEAHNKARRQAVLASAPATTIVACLSKSWKKRPSLGIKA